MDTASWPEILVTVINLLGIIFAYYLIRETKRKRAAIDRLGFLRRQMSRIVANRQYRCETTRCIAHLFFMVYSVWTMSRPEGLSQVMHTILFFVGTLSLVFLLASYRDYRGEDRISELLEMEAQLHENEGVTA